MMVIQAKFRIGDPARFLRLQIVDELAGFWLSTSQISEVFDTYLDTRGRELQEAGYRFRRREQPDGLMMTLATFSKSAGAIHRWEKWEILLESDHLPVKWPDSPVRTKMLQLIGDERLAPLVNLQQTRIVRQLCLGKQPAAELRLDSVSHRIDGKQHVYFEMEVEVIPPASETTLIEIADTLEEEWDLRPDQITKFELAYSRVAEKPVDRLIQTFYRPAYRLGRIL